VSAKHSQLWTQGSPGVPGAPASYDSFGSALTSADYDGDGYADVVVGVPEDEHESGSIELFRGSRKGLTARGSQLWTAERTGPLRAVKGGDFGYALVSGDFNGDGHPDLAVGAPDAVINGQEGGAVVVFYGSRQGLVKRTGQLWSQASRGVPDDPDFYNIGCTPDDCEESFGDGFGNDLAAGDFDGNGYQDLAVGVPGESVGDGSAHPSAPGAGAVQILTGGPGGLSATSQLLSQRSPGVAGRAEGYGNGGGYGDAFGATVLAADFDADGKGDLAIGAFSEEVESSSCRGYCPHGAVHVLYGSARGLTGRRSQFWRSHDIARAAPEFGRALAAGDFDGNGVSDLAVGASSQQVRQGRDDGGNGEVEVLMGEPRRGLSNVGR
jgi:hypothetical protein